MKHVVDVHTHWLVAGAFPELALIAPEKGATREVIGPNILSTYKGISVLLYEDFFNVEKANRVSEEAGVTLRLLSPAMQLQTFSQLLDIPTVEIARRINDAAASLMGLYPGRVLTMATISPFDKNHLREADRCLDELGMKGIYMDSSWNGEFLDDPRAWDFWEYAEAKGVTVFLHPPQLPIGWEKQWQYKLEEMIGRPFDTAMTAAKIIYSGVLDRFPNLRLLLAHMGGGLMTVIGRLDFGWRLGYEGHAPDRHAKNKLLPSEYLRRNFYVDTMGFWAPNVRQLIEVFGADRVLFGTDYGPVPISPKEHIGLVKSLRLSAADEDRIFWQNADELFGLALRTEQVASTA